MDAFSDIWEFDKRLREADEESIVKWLRGTEAAPTLYKSFGYFKAKDNAGIPIFVASEESADRYGDVVEVDGWDLVGFKKNPVLMFSHAFMMPPIGTVPRVWVEGKQLLNTVQWDMDDPLAAVIAGKYERKVMRAESVGFRPLEIIPNEGKGFRIKRQELLEISAVAIPAHPKAIQKALQDSKFTISMPDLARFFIPAPGGKETTPKILKGPISWQTAHPDGTVAASKDAAWNTDGEIAKADVAELLWVSAWADPDAGDKTGGFKFVHHQVSQGHPVILAGVTANLTMLNGGRGGTDIPDTDRRGVYNHLVRHLREDFELEPPELRSEEEVAEYKKQLRSFWEQGAAAKVNAKEKKADQITEGDLGVIASALHEVTASLAAK